MVASANVDQKRTGLCRGPHNKSHQIAQKYVNQNKFVVKIWSYYRIAVGLPSKAQIQAERARPLIDDVAQAPDGEGQENVFLRKVVRSCIIICLYVHLSLYIYIRKYRCSIYRSLLDLLYKVGFAATFQAESNDILWFLHVFEISVLWKLLQIRHVIRKALVINCLLNAYWLHIVHPWCTFVQP